MKACTVRLTADEAEVLDALMQACGLATAEYALLTALFNQCRLSDIQMPPGCFELAVRRDQKEPVSA